MKKLSGNHLLALVFQPICTGLVTTHCFTTIPSNYLISSLS
uniref:Uncharacterized protein n=1 Tax=Anguilla anguilla TaxID=7936 RepID=A0A0E9RNK3_ANGAN